MTDQQLTKLSSILKALTNPTRLRIVLLLHAKALPVNQISQALQVEQSQISHMLAKLTALGLTESRRVGKHVYYSLVDSLAIDPAIVTRLNQLTLPEATTKARQQSRSRYTLP